MGYMKSFLKVDRFGSSHRGGGGGGRSYGGVKFSVNEDVIELDVKNIESMMTENPEMRERLMKVINADMWKARNAVVNNLSDVFKNGDPMEARRAVRHVVSNLGGNLNIFNMKKGTASWNYRQKQRAEAGIGSSTGRGGNRRQRSTETAYYQGLEGKARGFILRWVNAGMTKTDPRKIKFKRNESRKEDKWNHNPNTGNRGAISARNFFGPRATAALNVVSQHLAAVIQEEIAKKYNENNQ